MRFEQRRKSFFTQMAELDSLRTQADYDTGSVSAATCWAIYSVANYFAPQEIVEVGTFIGRTALSMAQGTEDAGVIAEIHTCDASNGMELPQPLKCSLIQYPRQTSTSMLEKMRSDKHDWQIELIHLDGRLQDRDVDSLKLMSALNVVLALDDFEGIEKGALNYSSIRASGWLKSSVLIYPPERRVLERFGLQGTCTTALLVPSSLIALTNQ
ncbi:MAG: hypothetical protein IPG93_08415 [Burkholderiales bacterium]|nr:hypothetical protein [Burkholderiales bacterium]